MPSAMELADMNPDPDQDAIADFNLVCRVHSLYKRLVNQMMLSEIGVSLSQGGTLLHLAQGSGISYQDLAHLLGCGTSRISRLIHELEKRGLVKTWRSDTDRRVLHLALTPDGAALACHVPRVLREVERQMLSVLTGHERRRLLELLARTMTDVDRFCSAGEETQFG